MNKLDPEEQALLDAFESGILTRVENVDLDRQRHKDYAIATLQVPTSISAPRQSISH